MSRAVAASLPPPPPHYAPPPPRWRRRVRWLVVLLVHRGLPGGGGVRKQAHGSGDNGRLGAGVANTSLPRRPVMQPIRNTLPARVSLSAALVLVLAGGAA